MQIGSGTVTKKGYLTSNLVPWGMRQKLASPVPTLQNLSESKCYESGLNQLSGSGSRPKWPPKIKERNFMFWIAACSLLKAEGFSCSVDVLYGDPAMSLLKFLIKNIVNNFLAGSFCHFWSSKAWIQIRIGIQIQCWIWMQIRNQWSRIRNTAEIYPIYLHTIIKEFDPESKNPDPQPCWEMKILQEEQIFFILTFKSLKHNLFK